MRRGPSVGIARGIGGRRRADVDELGSAAPDQLVEEGLPVGDRTEQDDFAQEIVEFVAGTEIGPTIRP